MYSHKKLVKKDEVDKGRGRKECRTENTEIKKKATLYNIV
jgi:hypothetical protein